MPTTEGVLRRTRADARSPLLVMVAALASLLPCALKAARAQGATEPAAQRRPRRAV